MNQTEYIERLEELRTALVSINFDLDCAINGIDRKIDNGRSIYQIHPYSYFAVVKAQSKIKFLNELLKTKIDYEVSEQST